MALYSGLPPGFAGGWACSVSGSFSEGMYVSMRRNFNADICIGGILLARYMSAEILGGRFVMDT